MKILLETVREKIFLKNAEFKMIFGNSNASARERQFSTAVPGRLNSHFRSRVNRRNFREIFLFRSRDKAKIVFVPTLHFAFCDFHSPRNLVVPVGPAATKPFPKRFRIWRKNENGNERFF